MTPLKIAQSQVVQLTTQCVLLRGEIVTLKEALARERRQRACMVYPKELVSYEYRSPEMDDRTQAEIDREARGEHEADLERDGH